MEKRKFSLFYSIKIIAFIESSSDSSQWKNSMLKGKYNRIICLRNSTLVPAAQEVAALSGGELEAQSWEHCEFNIYYANFTAWSPSFPGEDLLNLLPASCALVTAENLLSPSQRMPIGDKMENFFVASLQFASQAANFSWYFC